MRIKYKRLLLAVTLVTLLANLALPVLAQNPTGAFAPLPRACGIHPKRGPLCQKPLDKFARKQQ